MQPSAGIEERLQVLPSEIFDLIIDHLVVAIGIQKAVLLRTTNRAFDVSIIRAICITQVIDIDDPATANLASRIDPTLRGMILAVKSLFTIGARKGYLSTVANVNRTLDSMINEPEQKLVKLRHEAVAGAVLLVDDCPVDAKIEAQNVLSGAAITGNISTLKSLLDHSEGLSYRVDVNGFTPYFHSPLTLAAARGHLGVVRQLLDCGARLDAVSSYWRQHRNLASQAEWNSQDEEIRHLALCEEPPSALRAAARGGHADIVHLLLRPEHRLPIASLEYLRAILASAEAGRLDLIGALFRAIRKDLSGFTGLGNEMLWVATRYDRKDVVQMLLDNGVDIDAFPDRFRTYYGALQIAASLGNTSMVHFLIDRGADVNLNGQGRDGYLPIEGAARCGQEEVVELLIKHGAHPSEALRSAAEGGQPRLMKLMLSRFPDLLNLEGDTGREALWKALAAGNLTAISMLVEGGVSLNDGYEHPSLLPLDLAKKYYGPWVVDHLISLGAQGTDVEGSVRRMNINVRCVRVSERTWEWVGKY